jgi:hypothetical protein
LAEPSDRLLRGARNIGAVAYVACDADLTVEPEVVAAAREHRHLRPGVVQLLRNGGADAAARARHERGLSAQFLHDRVPFS